ncbi:MAG: hypothetical protein NXI32_03995 [bacterium]|nr:hypothetical protein [bacterium]
MKPVGVRLSISALVIAGLIAVPLILQSYSDAGNLPLESVADSDLGTDVPAIESATDGVVNTLVGELEKKADLRAASQEPLPIACKEFKVERIDGDLPTDNPAICALLTTDFERQWSLPQRLPFNSDANDQTATFSPDGLSLYFSSDRSGRSELWQTTRASIEDTWDSPRLVETIPHCWSPSVSSDGSLLTYHSVVYKTLRQARLGANLHSGYLQDINTAEGPVYGQNPHLVQGGKRIFYTFAEGISSIDRLSASKWGNRQHWCEGLGFAIISWMNEGATEFLIDAKVPGDDRRRTYFAKRVGETLILYLCSGIDEFEVRCFSPDAGELVLNNRFFWGNTHFDLYVSRLVPRPTESRGMETAEGIVVQDLLDDLDVERLVVETVGGYRFQIVSNDRLRCELPGGPAIVELTLKAFSECSRTGAERIAEMANLEVLGLHLIKGLTESDIARFSQLPRLRTLNLTQSPVSNNVLQQIADSCQDLEFLSLLWSDFTISVDTVRSFTKLPQLRVLGLPSGVDMSPEMAGALSDLKGLEELYLIPTTFEASEQTREKIAAALLDLPQLQRLLVSSWVSDRELEILSRQKTLAELKLVNASVSNGGTAFLKDLPELKRLELSNNQEITDDCIQHLKHLQDLEWLKIYSTGISSDGVEQLRKSLPDCTIEFN